MPAQAKSLQITERYRAGMIRLRKQGQREAARSWRQVNPDDLDGTFPLGMLELTVSTLQREAARLSSAYLSTFIASELGEPERPPALSVWDKTFNGNDLREGLRSAIITAKMAIKDGTDPREATKASRKILVSDVGLFIDTAARESLRQGMEMDDRIVGYQRALKGTCGACSGSTSYEAFSENAPVVPLNVHPHCQCVAEPVVRMDTKQHFDTKAQERRGNLAPANAIQAIDDVHRLPDNCPTIPFRTMRKNARGEAGLRFDKEKLVPLDVEVKASVHEAIGPEGAILHELGHYMDLAAFRGEGIKGFASLESDVLNGVLAEVRNTKFFKDLKAIAAKEPTSATETAKYINTYALDPRELIARSYAQYIGDRAGYTRIMPERYRTAYTQQFTKAEMKRISRAWDDVWRKRGLLK